MIKSPVAHNMGVVFLKRYFRILLNLIFFLLLLFIPYSFAWIYYDGDLALERVVNVQAQGEFALFGSGISQNFMEYKLALYKKIKPEICVVGSSRVMQFRGSWFKKPFLNMGGVAGNLAELRYAIAEMCEISPPVAIIIGIDFWWFMPEWEKEPFNPLTFKTGAYEFDAQKLKKPWVWLLDGKLTLMDLLKPLSASIANDPHPARYGIMAQQYSEGFGPDGSWYNTGELTGKKIPFDFQFKDTLEQVEAGIKAFYHIEADRIAPAQEHLKAFLEILLILKKKNVKFWLFIPPLAPRVIEVMEKNKLNWPHLFNLQKSLQEKGYEVPDFSSVTSLNSSDCEFIDGFHGGEIVYARILRQLARENPLLNEFINLKYIDTLIETWHGHAMSPNPLVTHDPELDFHNFNCPKGTSLTSAYK